MFNCRSGAGRVRFGSQRSSPFVRYGERVAPDEIGFPEGGSDEKALLLEWLDYLRGAVLRNVDGIDDAQARWTPDGELIPLLGIVNHLTKVEWRWIEGGFQGATVERRAEEFRPGDELTLAAAIVAYRERARSAPLPRCARCRSIGPHRRRVGLTDTTCAGCCCT